MSGSRPLPRWPGCSASRARSSHSSARPTRPPPSRAGSGSDASFVAIATASAATGRVRYRPRRLTALDARIMAAVLAAPAGLALLGALGDHSLSWTPAQPGFPPFHPVVALVLLALAAPALVRADARGRARVAARLTLASVEADA